MTNTNQVEIDFGPLSGLMSDDAVSKIMVNSPDQVYIEQEGKLHRVDVSFKNNDHIIEFINKLLASINANVQISPDRPHASARFSDGSRLQAFVPPIAVSGPSLTISKSLPDLLWTLEHLLTFGSLSQDMADFLQTCVQARLNIIIAGGVNSGKATLFNVIASTIPVEERIVTVEEEAEFRLRHKHVVTLESRPANQEGQGEISVQDLLRLVPRARPDRVLIGELRGPEVLEALRLMDLGYEGMMTLMFADNPQEALERLEMMVKLNDPNLPASYLRALIGSAVNLVVQINQLEDGKRKITRITEVASLRGGDYDLRDVFVFQREGFEQGKVIGHFESHPVSVSLMRRMEARDITLPPSLVVATGEEYIKPEFGLPAEQKVTSA